MIPDLEFEDEKGVFSLTTYDGDVHIICQTKGSYEHSSYDYGSYHLNESEVDEVIRVLQEWKSSH